MRFWKLFLFSYSTLWMQLYGKIASFHLLNTLTHNFVLVTWRELFLLSVIWSPLFLRCKSSLQQSRRRQFKKNDEAAAWFQHHGWKTSSPRDVSWCDICFQPIPQLQNWGLQPDVGCKKWSEDYVHEGSYSPRDSSVTGTADAIICSGPCQKVREGSCSCC